MKIGLLGGSFDPIHVGHLQIAKTALQKLGLDEVWFIPAKDAPLKNGAKASFEHRVKMIEQTIGYHRKMKISLIEKREGTSYTIDTILLLKKLYPDHQFYFLIGDDQARQFDRWKDHEQLLDEVTFCVVSRGEGAILHEKMHRLTMELVDVSSSEIRNGQKRWALHKNVKKYIGKYHLYMESYIQSMMNEKRYHHSERVAKLCVEFAKAHQLDEQKAYIMGICHDICKQLPYEKAQCWMKYHMLDHMQEAVGIWHGYIGAYYVKHHLYIEDHDIISAIYHHVLGDGTSAYDKILYIADKVDPGRGYDVSKQIQLTKKNLDLGLQYVKNEQERYLKEQGVVE